MAPVWKIVWTDGGGIPAREGRSRTSKKLGDILATGAEVEQVKLIGEELEFKKLSGLGPMSGWTTVGWGCRCGSPVCPPFFELASCISGLDDFQQGFSLNVDFDSGEAVTAPPAAGVEAPAAKAKAKAPEPSKEVGPVPTPPAWKQVVQPQIEFTQLKSAAERKLPGDYYGLAFPSSKDELLQMGARWLTEAFHASGVLPKDNAVTKIFDADEFVGGGAGLKCTLKVEYKTDKPYLHKALFIKFPHKPEGSDRFYVSCMWNHDRPEIVFNIWIGAHIPYRIPKCYFADICAQTTNFIMITESLPWCKRGTKHFSPGDVEPAYDKFKDWELPDTPTYYLALCRSLGHIAGCHKAGKLHQQINDMFPMPDAIQSIPKDLPGIDPDSTKMNNAKVDQLIKFVSETAQAVFPKEITDKTWLAQFKKEMMHVMDYRSEVHCFCSGAGTRSPHEYVAFTHQNLQVDNAFFWRDEKSEMQVGLLDWGVTGCNPVINSIQGCISGAETDVLLGHRDEFLRAFRDSYRDNGGPALNLERLRQMSNLQMMMWATSIISNVTQVLKFTKVKEWKDINDWMDDRLVNRFQTRTHCSQFKIALQLWQKWSLYDKFLAWIEQEGLPASKVNGAGPAPSGAVPAEELMQIDANHPAKARCDQEMAKKSAPWQFIGMEVLLANHAKELPGLRYGLAFPHTPELLIQGSAYGAAWLTKAFHAAGTIPTDNKVKRIVRTKPLTGGGACLKAMIEVEYERHSPTLHTKLFMKYPWLLDGKSRSDRMNSSINLQPMDVAEIDAYRLMEARLPFPVPKFYFGDISNETTNFILITELIDFGDKAKTEFKPGEVEPAYDKFFDDEQFRDPHEYYSLLARANATMAGLYKAGSLGDAVKLDQFFLDSSGNSPPPMADQEFKAKMRMGEEFLRNAKSLFPPDMITEGNLKMWKRILNIANTYRPELAYLGAMSMDYWAICHGNFNVDNTWWWRDESRKLHIGALDWGGLSKVSLPQKLWWSLYACEFHYLEKNLDKLISIVIETYHRAGGPKLDTQIFRRDFMIAAVEQMLGLLGAVPQIYRVISKKVWTAGEVKDRDDPRLRESFLTRMYVMGMVLIFRLIVKWDLTQMFEDLIKQPGMPSKTVSDL